SRVGPLGGHRERSRGAVLPVHARRGRATGPVRAPPGGLLDHRADLQGARIRAVGADAILPLLRTGRASPSGDPGTARPPPPVPRPPAPRAGGSIRPLPPLRSPAFDEADISDKPWHARFERTFTPRGVAYELDDARRPQLETLRSLDRSVGQLVGALRQRGVLDRTVIVYLSDNGFLWGGHRLGGKIWPYEESIHVPLVVRTPWRDGDGGIDRHMTLNVDLA